MVPNCVESHASIIAIDTSVCCAFALIEYRVFSRFQLVSQDEIDWKVKLKPIICYDHCVYHSIVKVLKEQTSGPILQCDSQGRLKIQWCILLTMNDDLKKLECTDRFDIKFSKRPAWRVLEGALFVFVDRLSASRTYRWSYQWFGSYFRSKKS